MSAVSAEPESKSDSFTISNLLKNSFTLASDIHATQKEEAIYSFRN